MLSRPSSLRPSLSFFQVVDVTESADFVPSPTTNRPTLTFDPEWLAITRAFNPYMSTTSQQNAYPDEAAAREAVAQNLEWVQRMLADKGIRSVADVQQFAVTAPPPGAPGASGRSQRESAFAVSRGGVC